MPRLLPFFLLLFAIACESDVSGEPSSAGAGSAAGGGHETAGAGRGGGAGQGGGAGHSSGGLPSAGNAAAGGAGGSASGGTDGAPGGAAGSASTAGAGSGTGGAVPRWVGTWACAPQTTEQNNLPPSPGLSGNTLRQMVRVSLGGAQLRLRLSNEHGTSAVSMSSVHVALSKSGGAIDTASDRALTFNGMAAVTIAAGEAVFSDSLAFDLAPLSDLAISIHFSNQSGDVTGHPGSRTTSFLQLGDAVATASLASATKTEHWYFITGLDVMADASSAAIVILGDSITDGRGSTTDQNNRWPDLLARRLQANAATSKLGVLNLGIGGNTVLSGGLGPPATQRFERDVLQQSGARWLLVLEGVNDIGASGDAAVASSLIEAYRTFIMKARQAGLRAYGIPILPIGGSQFAGGESARQLVNDWIRTSNAFDAVIDLDAAVRDPAQPTQLLAMYDSGDHLHLSPAGYQKMADSIDLSLFSP